MATLVPKSQDWQRRNWNFMIMLFCSGLAFSSSWLLTIDALHTLPKMARGRAARASSPAMLKQNPRRETLRVSQFRGWETEEQVLRSYAMAREPKLVWDDYPSPSIVVSSDPQLGNFTSVQDAVDNALTLGLDRVVILILPGYYKEKVVIPRNKTTSLMLQGTDAENTIISFNDWAGKLNADGTPLGTYSSCSVCVYADFFAANNITFQNSAQLPPPFQNETYPAGMAVALRISGNYAAFYNCRFVGWQDTLYDHKGTHYFRNCYFEGNVDFIFGNGRSIYESCAFYGKPSGFGGAVAAQQRCDPTEDTGFLVMRSNITANNKLYLGRAWGNYSRVVISNSFVDDVISNGAWFDWGDPERQQTSYFAEFSCWGPGMNTTAWVTWSHQLDAIEAAPFISYDFINASAWLGPPPEGTALVTSLPFKSPYHLPSFVVPDPPHFPYM